ncbi:serpin family protein [Streptomyces lancefieldiae]|uniref:Serpin family protein n=1 Tax=Streptomyces lancefieldiae TaxID=3075520 RepID=A0ABU3AX24_9ACTN|nr:serpin family protein [Streptomyces sp. DSM 40712]MDT0614564.1 serpin family protein [Streptomyces sp. DSM 40712]
MRVTGATVRAVNGLTARWAATTSGGTVFSAVGVWPLLALLADGAAGAARAELEEAVGVRAGRAAGAARELLAGLGSVGGLETALGLWTGRTLELRDEWAAGLPAEAHGVLTGDAGADQEALDAWAAKRTGGLVERLPVVVAPGTELVLASALALRTRWLRPFRETYLAPEGGPWEGRELLGLCRESALLDRVGVADTPDGRVTGLKVLGDTAVDVHLLLGEEGMTPGQVLGAGIGVLARTHPVTPGSRLPYGEVGPGLAVQRERTRTPRPPTLDVTTPAYALTAGHDLLERPELFGLASAVRAVPGPFPGVSPSPLCVETARQAAVARFGARGFEAAAVTAIGAIGCAAPGPLWLSTTVRAVLDRPFGFLAVHRHSRLALAAGWVTDPEPYREDELPH